MVLLGIAIISELVIGFSDFFESLKLIGPTLLFAVSGYKSGYDSKLALLLSSCGCLFRLEIL